MCNYVDYILVNVFLMRSVIDKKLGLEWSKSQLDLLELTKTVYYEEFELGVPNVVIPSGSKARIKMSTDIAM